MALSLDQAAASLVVLIAAVFGGDLRVVDGDTVRIAGERYGTRLVGFNAPETDTALCSAERRLGQQAKARLQSLVASAGTVDLTKTACACPPGTQGTELCNYGRSCGVLLADGIDVGQILIREGLAVPFNCGATGCPPTPRPWCN